MVVCRQCGRPDVQGTLYCQNCGASLEPGEPSLFRGDASTLGATESGESRLNGSGAGSALPDAMGTPPPTALGPRSGGHISADQVAPIAQVDPMDLLEPTDKAPHPPRPQRMRPTARIARPPTPHNTPRLPMPPAPPTTPPYTLPEAVELRLPNGHIFLLSGKQEYRVGRRDVGQAITPDVDFTDWNGAAAGVSRDHLGIFLTSSGVFVEDHESTNDTLCNGSRLQPRQQYLLRDRDELRLGTIMLRVLFVYPSQTQAAGAATVGNRS